MRREEWRQQTELCRITDRWLPADAFWTATDPIAPTALSGALRRLRGVKRGVPDVLIWCRRTRPIVIEMKSPGVRCTAAQRATREASGRFRVAIRRRGGPSTRPSGRSGGSARRRERTRARALEVAAATRRDDGARSERRAGSWAASEAPPR
jgi:hypothetical protein